MWQICNVIVTQHWLNNYSITSNNRLLVIHQRFFSSKSQKCCLQLIIHENCKQRMCTKTNLLAIEVQLWQQAKLRNHYNVFASLCLYNSSHSLQVCTKSTVWHCFPTIVLVHRLCIVKLSQEVISIGWLIQFQTSEHRNCIYLTAVFYVKMKYRYTQFDNVSRIFSLKAVKFSHLLYVLLVLLVHNTK